MRLSEDCDWATDPAIKEQVMKELNGIRAGKLNLAMVLSMGKREKKKCRIGKNMGSCLILYYPIVFRICEQMIMGNILDAISLRSCNPMAVGHMNPLDYFQLMFEDKLEAGRAPHDSVNAVADDIAGWDTQIGRRDLEMEHWSFNQFSTGIDHASLVTGLYCCYADHITLLKRPRGAQVELSVIREKKGRLSGTIVTYVGNTIVGFLAPHLFPPREGTDIILFSCS